MPATPDCGQLLLDYHERTKHHLHRFARSAGYMDWANQPAPFRTYGGTRSLPLPLTASDPLLDYADLYRPSPAQGPAAMTFTSVGALFELSLGLSAWKAIPGHRWALRMNPSSGNLHPTEAHLIALGITDLPDGLYHYHPLEHALETRAGLPPHPARKLAAHFPPPCLLVVLSTLYWREAWKYGERAFRYCQHDLGHALAALRLSARLHDWRLLTLEAADEDIAAAFGFDRTAWPPGEAEAPALVAVIRPSSTEMTRQVFPPELAAHLAALDLVGTPSRLSPRHRAWDIISQASAASRRPRPSASDPAEKTVQPEDGGAQEDGADGPDTVVHPPPAGVPAAQIIRQRRSAQAFDSEGTLSREAFLGLLDRTRPRSSRPPFDSGIAAADISLALFVHRVQGITPGLYAFIRHPGHCDDLRRAMSARFRWEPAAPDMPLYLLEAGDCRSEAIELSCRQEIAGESTFSLGMLARFGAVVRDRPWAYNRLFWEAGLIGQVLYLEAEAQGVRGTGIGCYFDDAVHARLGLSGRGWQSLYHFTIGVPLEDRRVQTLPPYFHLGPEGRKADHNA